MMKKCSTCRVEKNLSEFGKQKEHKDGHRGQCRDCMRSYHKKHRQLNIKRLLESEAKYRRENKEKVKGSNARYVLNNPERVKSKRVAYRKSPIGKAASERARNRNINAKKARSYYHKRKHRLTIPNNCQCCKKANKLEAHHHDYNLPMDVTYLCQKCHAIWHMNNIPLNKTSGIFTENK